MKDLRSARQWP